MAVSTNFLLFNEANKEIDTMNDSEYQGATMRRNGVASGIADRRLHNKFYRQASIVSKALADFIVSHGYNASDADLDVFRTNLENALNHLSNSGIGSHNVSTSAHSNLFSSFRETSNGLYVPKTGGTISGNVTVTGSTTTGTLTVGGASTLKGNVGVTGDVSASGYVYSATPAQTDNSTKSATTEFVRNAVSALVNSSPAALDTLKELATALGNDPNFATTMTNALATKAPLASPALTGNPTAPTAGVATNSTQIATTAFVQSLINTLKSSNITDFVEAAKAAATARITGDVSNANSWWVGIPGSFGTLCIQGVSATTNITGEAVFNLPIAFSNNTYALNFVHEGGDACGYVVKIKTTTYALVGARNIEHQNVGSDWELRAFVIGIITS